MHNLSELKKAKKYKEIFKRIINFYQVLKELNLIKEPTK